MPKTYREREEWRRATYTPEQWAAYVEQKRGKQARRQAKRLATPEARAKHAERQRKWRERNPAAYRAIAQRYRAKHGRAVPVAFTDPKYADELYARIHKLVASSNVYRDDIISDVYLGVLEGVLPSQVTAEHVKQVARKYTNESYKAVSLNAPRGETTLGQLIGVY